MKEYVVRYKFAGEVDVFVSAENDEEARKKADIFDVSLNDYETLDYEIVDVNEWE